MGAVAPTPGGVAALSVSSRAAAYQSVLLRLQRFARADSVTVLLQGESGTGKTMLARQLHAQSRRAAGHFQHVVLSTLDDSLAGSELFGHVAGAFTDAKQARAGHFASASGGTLFLDEIGKASRVVQGKLLHALEYQIVRPIGADRDVRVNVRIVAATNVDLGLLAAEDRFLPDLWARLATFRITIPPLRERRADIPDLVHDSVRKHAPSAGYGSHLPAIHQDLLAALQRAPWPGNLRELDGTVHRLLVEADGASCVTPGHCTDELAGLVAHGRTGTITKAQLDEALSATGTLSGAARRLGVDRKTLRVLRGKNER